MPAKDQCRCSRPKTRRVFLLVGYFATVALAGLSPADAAPSIPPAAPALINQYCAPCHNPGLKSGGISLRDIDLSNIPTNADTLEKVLRKLHSGEMPPPGMPRPDAKTSADFTRWLASALDQSAAVHVNPGRATIHRLNRAEYSNAVRDLLGLDINAGAMLPQDDTGYGFDNIGEVLSLAPVLIERYMSVARTVSRLAVGDPGLKPEMVEFRPPKGMRRRERISDDVPFDSAGGLAVSYRVPVDAEYVLRMKLSPATSFDGPQAPNSLELRLPIKAGTRSVAVTFPRQEAVPENVTVGLRGIAPPKPADPPRPPSPASLFVDLWLDGARLKSYDLPEGSAPALTSLTISGPYNIRGPGDTLSREKIFICKPASEKDEEPCAQEIISALAHRAFRRPVSVFDIQPLVAFYQHARREGNFASGIEMALRAILVSPDFLFRIERDPAGLSPGSPYRLNDCELASRLSFFLWSSIPDDELLRVAETGTLHQPDVLSSQVGRMLDDPRAKSLVSNFAGQWLYLRNLAQVKPDPDEFPEFDLSLRQSFERETSLFFTDILRSGRPVTDLLDSKFTYLNQRLAEHYGVPNIYGSQFRRVEVTDPNRGGLLGQGSILTVTSYPNRTSVVQRGKWILENLLGAPPPPPPPEVPNLKPHAEDGSLLTMREQMEAHRTNAVCAACHARMDPLGFALENYDGVGKWRLKEAGRPINAEGKLPDGTEFDGMSGLRHLLLTSRRDDFVQTVTERLLTYALGRGLELSDRPAVRSIVRDASAAEPNAPAPGFRALIDAIVKSVPFQMRRTSAT